MNDWEIECDELFNEDTLVSAHKDWTPQEVKEFVRQQKELSRREGYMEAVERLSSGFIEWYNSRYDDQSAGILYKSWIEAFLKAKINK